MAEARRAFPGGAPDLIAQFSDWADRRMAEELARQGEAFSSLKVREKIALAVRTRLEVLEPHKEAVRRSGAVLALPNHAGLAAASVYRTVDAMWHAAGDSRSEEHTSELQSLMRNSCAVFCLQKKNQKQLTKHK